MNFCRFAAPGVLLSHLPLPRVSPLPSHMLAPLHVPSTPAPPGCERKPGSRGPARGSAFPTQQSPRWLTRPRHTAPYAPLPTSLGISRLPCHAELTRCRWTKGDALSAEAQLRTIDTYCLEKPSLDSTSTSDFPTKPWTTAHSATLGLSVQTESGTTASSSPYSGAASGSG